MLYTDVIDPILARVEGCPRALVVDAMRNSCMDFCTRTRFLTTGVSVTLTGAEVPTFDLDTQVVDILEAKITDKKVLVTFLNDPDAEADTLGAAGYDYAIRFTDPNNAEITAADGQTAPSVATPITVEMLIAIAPGPTSTEIHTDLWRKYSEALKHGALYRLYAEPNKVWSNPSSVGYHKDEFEEAIKDASLEAGRNRIQPARRLRVRTL